MKFFPGMDNGGTTTTAALYDAHGHEIGVASRDTRMLTPRPGYIERDMEEMWTANCGVIRDVLEKTAVARRTWRGRQSAAMAKACTCGERMESPPETASSPPTTGPELIR